MKIMDYGNMATPTGVDALLIHDNETETTKHITVTALFSVLYPIGSIYTNADNSSNPSTLFGFGTWEVFGAGRVPVGYDASQVEFNTGGKTGGAKTVSLNGDQNGTHSHGVYDPGHWHIVNNNVQVVGSSTLHLPGSGFESVSYGNQGTTSSGSNIGIYNSGSGAPHNNLQPYITVYMWRRTA